MELQTITAFLAIGAAIIIGFIGNAIFAKYRIPEVLILVAFGMLIGPDILGNRFGLVTDRTIDDISQFKDLFLSMALVWRKKFFPRWKKSAGVASRKFTSSRSW